jgi:hypothetical protein
MRWDGLHVRGDISIVRVQITLVVVLAQTLEDAELVSGRGSCAVGDLVLVYVLRGGSGKN